MSYYKYITCLILFFITSCREDINLNLEESDPQIVIDSGVSYLNYAIKSSDGSTKIETSVFLYANLSLTKGYYEDSSKVTGASDAKVYITEEYKNSTVKYELKPVNSNNQGSGYSLALDKTRPNYAVNYDATYTLEINYNGQKYVSSKENLIRTPIIKNIISKQVENPFRPGEQGVEVEAYFDDDKTSDNYYLLYVPSLGNYLNNDKLYDGKSQYVFKVREPNSSYELKGEFKLSSISSKYYTYLKIIESQSGGSSGPPNNTAKAPVRGNIYNTTNEVKFPLGYFNVREIKFYDKK